MAILHDHIVYECSHLPSLNNIWYYHSFFSVTLGVCDLHCTVLLIYMSLGVNDVKLPLFKSELAIYLTAVENVKGPSTWAHKANALPRSDISSICFIEIESCSVAQAGLKLQLSKDPTECYESECRPPHLATWAHFQSVVFLFLSFCISPHILNK